uniref:ADP-ribosylation factor GTPase activating protein 3 n=1 Tax=Cyprinodon variegatus TaxID=28743 RepID=A0A3Q2FTC0_CYPVA
MAEPSRQDISAIFKRLRSIPTNKVSFYGRQTFGSTELDFNWSWFQLRCMQVGGNASAVAFFNQHGCKTSAANAKYNSRAAQLYREKIKTLATQATRRHGTELWLDSQGPLSPTSPEDKQVDFFSLHSQVKDQIRIIVDPTFILISGNSEEGPSVELLSVSPKSTPGLFKSFTLASKKGGLGAHKVSSQNFSQVEKAAQAADKLREKEESSTSDAKRNVPSDESITTSMRLAYKDIEQQRKQEEKKLKGLEGNKKEQAERLGMGLGMRSGVSHSVMSDMHIIQQESPLGAKSTKGRRFAEEDEYEGTFSSRWDKYIYINLDLIFSTRWGADDGNGGGWMKESKKPEPDFYLSSTMSSLDDRTVSRKKADSTPISDSGEARKKFGGDVKAISSDMYFGKQDNSEYETRTRLERFAGSASISSADLFDDPKKETGGSYRLTNVLPSAPDMSGLKLGMRSVAGKLSVMASGVVNTIQDHYNS